MGSVFTLTIHHQSTQHPGISRAHTESRIYMPFPGVMFQTFVVLSLLVPLHGRPSLSFPSEHLLRSCPSLFFVKAFLTFPPLCCIDIRLTEHTAGIAFMVIYFHLSTCTHKINAIQIGSMFQLYW